VKREQVHRLYKEKFRLGEQRAIDNKKQQGYPLSIFNDFVVKDGCSYSFKEH
jgi:hypothetical protein